MRKLGIIIAAAVLFCGCQEERLISAFSARDEIRLQVGGVEQLSYDHLTCQLGFNIDNREFRVHTDNMSDFFSLRLSSIPTEDEEQVTGSLAYTTRTDVVHKSNITLKVVRLEGDRIWLWNQASRIGVEIQILE